MLLQFKTAVDILAVVTAQSLPQTISAREAGLHNKVSSVPRSFSPATKSIAG